jgi:aerobic-type carbon monoxide dehydrogenase small subunit (CoxS/CutS family)
MSDEERKVDEQSEQEEGSSGAAVTRRQFLIGAGAGLVVGAVGAAGIMSANAPAPVVQTAPPAQSAPTAAAQQQPPASQPTTAPAATVKAAVDGPVLVSLNINGRDYKVAVSPETTLLDVLKRDLGLTGTKLGCNGSMCSACTVLVDGVAMNSCSLLALREGGRKITTIEGLEKDGKLHPVQQAFWDNMGYQCGFCTPGQILGAVELLSKNKAPTEEQIKLGMSGHMCKCSAYPNIVKSVQAAAKAMA